MLQQVCFGFLALIHIVPAIAAIMPSQLSKLYGVQGEDRVLISLLQHRAVLLGNVGFAFLAAAIRPTEAIAWHAVLLGAASMASFLVIAAINRQLRGPLRKIALIDLAGLIPLAWLFWRQPWASF
ncbi:MAG: hypothetical protein RLO80_08055 [Hyphomonas sp.]